jgi:hypothetical protein
MTVSNTEQDYLDNDEIKAYYSDSLDEDSLDGSKPVRYHDEEDTSGSFDSSGGDNSDNIDGKEENILDNIENGVMEYFSDFVRLILHNFHQQYSRNLINHYHLQFHLHFHYPHQKLTISLYLNL